MNIEEIDKWLYNEYGTSYTRLEELHDYFFEKYTDQKEEIERLKGLCDKYEEEHKTTFEEWKKTINIIKEVRKYIQDRYDGEVLTHTFDKDNVGELLEILDKGE